MWDTLQHWDCKYGMTPKGFAYIGYRYSGIKRNDNYTNNRRYSPRMPVPAQYDMLQMQIEWHAQVSTP